MIGRHILAFVMSALLSGAPLLAQPGLATGAIQGTAQNAAGQTLANFTVNVRNLQTGEIASTTTSNSAGSFSFTGLNPANYVIEIVNQAGVVVGTSSAITVAAGATVTVSVSAAAAAAIAAAGGVAAAGAAGLSTAVIVTSVAAAAGLAGVVVAVSNASPSQ